MGLCPPADIMNTDLVQHECYWPEADKQTVARALLGEPDGSYIIRNASEEGQYTLSVKVNNEIKLLRIIFSNQTFSLRNDVQTFGSIEDLIKHYQVVSLAEFNPTLTTCLLHPISMASKMRSSDNEDIFHVNMNLVCTSEKEWREIMQFENLRHLYVACVRAEGVHSVHNRNLKELLAVFKPLCLDIRKSDLKLRSLKTLLESEADMDKRNILEESIQEVLKELASQRENKTSFSRLMNAVSTNRVDAEEQYHELRKAYLSAFAAIDKAIIDKYPMGFLAERCFLMEETPQMVAELLKMDVNWMPEQYLMCETSEKRANQALFNARKRLLATNKTQGKKDKDRETDGIFLIRQGIPDEKKLPTFILSILNKKTVTPFHIKCNEAGWAIGNSIRFPAISDLVRYYAHHGVPIPKKGISLRLCIPAFEPVMDNENLLNGPREISNRCPGNGWGSLFKPLFR